MLKRRLTFLFKFSTDSASTQPITCTLCRPSPIGPPFACSPLIILALHLLCHLTILRLINPKPPYFERPTKQTLDRPTTWFSPSKLSCQLPLSLKKCIFIPLSLAMTLPSLVTHRLIIINVISDTHS